MQPGGNQTKRSRGCNVQKLAFARQYDRRFRKKTRPGLKTLKFVKSEKKLAGRK